MFVCLSAVNSRINKEKNIPRIFRIDNYGIALIQQNNVYISDAAWIFGMLRPVIAL